jgi:hypothetical protein
MKEKKDMKTPNAAKPLFQLFFCLFCSLIGFFDSLFAGFLLHRQPFLLPLQPFSSLYSRMTFSSFLEEGFCFA